jgi:D-alanine-D-alanine ligase
VRALRVAVLVHQDLVPPSSLEGLSEQQAQAVRTEYDVSTTLEEMGHEVQVLGVSHDLAPIRSVVEGFEPHVVFNLLMEFRDVGLFQAHVASYLELLGVRSTGCNPRGILLSRDKALAKKILRYHRIPTPTFAVVPPGRRLRRLRGLRYPLIVKSLDEEASLGIAQASIVRDAEHLDERVAFVHRHVGGEAIVEEYVDGRELTVGVLGNERLRTFPPWELFFGSLPEGTAPIATARVKWDLDYQRRAGIRSGPAELPPGFAARLAHLARRVYRCLGLSAYARIDLRLTAEGEPYVLEANATPDAAREEDFALSARAAGLEYAALLQRILNLALRYRPPGVLE